MPIELVKGNDALLRGAILGGCRMFFGYPITPSNEIAEGAASLLPALGGTFVQAECEVGAIQMVYGAASAGERVMTASSGPGISLKQEGISYMVGSELPAVIIDIMRGGPGLGNIAPAQGDYFQVVKGGGHGGYHLIVLAPNSPQEMCDLTLLAFELADRYRNPVVVLSDGFTGQMMEAVEFPEPVSRLPRKDWAVRGTAETAHNLINSIRLMPEQLEEHVDHLFQKFAVMEAEEVRFEEVQTEDAELIVIGYGIVSRLLRAAVTRLRDSGLPVGMLRPLTLWPFPGGRVAELAETAQGFLVAELSKGQMIEDVRLAVNGRKPVAFHGRAGGSLPSVDELVHAIEGAHKKGAACV